MKKRITTKTRRTGEKFGKEKLTIGLDLGDRSSRYCVLDEQGDVILEGSIATTRTCLEVCRDADWLWKWEPIPRG